MRKDFQRSILVLLFRYGWGILSLKSLAGRYYDHDRDLPREVKKEGESDG
jgi:hypothetical protein